MSIGLSGVTVAPTPFQVTTSGLVATIRAGSVADAVGTLLSYAGGTLTLLANKTTYLYLMLYDGTIQPSLRCGYRGGILIATVITNSSKSTSIVQPTKFDFPRTRIPRSLGLLQGSLPIGIGGAGDSVMEGAGPSSGQDFWNRLFTSSSSSYGQNHPNVANISRYNWAVGGTSAIYGFALSGDLCALSNSYINALTSGYNLRPYGNMRSSTPKVNSIGPSAIDKNLPSLVIVEYGLNISPSATGQTAKQLDSAFVEAQCRAWRKKGVEGILVAPYQGADGNQAARTYLQDGACIQRIAKNTGFEFCEWYGFIEYAYLLGLAPYSGDNLHPSNAGSVILARCVGGLVHPYVVDSESFTMGKPVEAYGSNASTNTRASWAQFQCVYAGTGAAAATARSSQNLNVTLNGNSGTTATCELEVGETYVCGHGATLGVYMQHELASGATATITLTTAGNVLNKTINLTGGSNTQVTRLLSYDELAAFGTSGFLLNGAAFSFQAQFTITLTVIAGASVLPIVGIIFLTHDTEDIPFSQVDYGGTWTDESSRDNLYNIKYTDSANSSIAFKYRGDYAIAYFEVGSNAGTYDAYVDGVQVASNVSLNSQGGGTYIYALKLCPQGNTGATKPISNMRGEHSVRIVLHTAGGSTAAGNRSMALTGIRQLKAD